MSKPTELYLSSAGVLGGIFLAHRRPFARVNAAAADATFDKSPQI